MNVLVDSSPGQPPASDISTTAVPSGPTSSTSRSCGQECVTLSRFGLQFHLEVTPASVRALVDHCREDLIPGPFVQSEREILDVPDSWFLEINGLMSAVLSWLTREVGRP